MISRSIDAADAVDGMIDRLAASPLASLAAILVFALVCFLPGFSTIPPLDGDEPSYAVAAREMVRSGNYAAIAVQSDEYQIVAPRGEPWAASLAAVLSGGAGAPIWAYRIPSLIGAVAAAMLTWWAAIALTTRRAALLAGILFAGGGVLGLEARLVAPDALLVGATTLALGALARIWRRDQPAKLPLVLAFWGGIGAGILLKGVVAPAMAVMTAAVLSVQQGSVAWLKRTRPLVGLVSLAAAVAPWLIAILAAHLGGTGAPDGSFLARIGVPIEMDAPPGTYALIAPLIAGPAMTFIFAASGWIGANTANRAVFYALAWGIPYWLAVELVQPKLPQIILPMVPAVAILAAVAIEAGGSRIGGKASAFFSSGPLVWPPIVAAVVPIAFWMIEGWFPLVALFAFIVAACLGPLAWVWLKRGKAAPAAIMAVASAAFIYLGFFGVMLPGFSVLRVGERVVASAAAGLRCSPPHFASAGYPEESLVFAAGPETLLTDGAGAADFLNIAGCRVAAVDTSQISSFRQRAEDLGIDLVDRGRVTGFNLRKMRVVDIHLFVAGTSP